MTIAYEEFTSTNATIRDDLVTKILAHSAWNEVTLSHPSTTSTASWSATNLTVTSTAAFTVGQSIKITPSGGGTPVYRYVVSITSATIMVVNASPPSTFVSGATVEGDGRFLKATAPSGLVLCLEIAQVVKNAITYRLFRDHTGTNQAGAVSATDWRYVYFHNLATMADSAVVHAVLSVSDTHLFFSLEGPYANETGATSTTYGSLRNYMFMDEIFRYHDTDLTPALASWGVTGGDSSPAIADLLWRCEVSRDAANAASWGLARLPTVTMPHFATGAATNVSSHSTITNQTYLWPYIVVSDADGPRGRLRNLFFAGLNRTTYAIDPVVTMGELITIGDVVYKTLAPHKGDGTQVAGGGLGFYSGTNTSNDIYGAPIIAVPYADVA